MSVGNKEYSITIIIVIIIMIIIVNLFIEYDMTFTRN